MLILDLCKQPLRVAILPILVLIFMVACDSPSGDGRKLSIFVSIQPQAAIVEHIVDTLADVHVLLGPAESPATYNPSPQQIVRLLEADILFTTGVPFERNLISKIRKSHESLKVVDTRKNVPLLQLSAHDDNGHTHESSTDPHIWLDPDRVKVQAQTIARTLVDLAPEDSTIFFENLRSLLRLLAVTDDSIKTLLDDCRGNSFWAFHPAYGYFADAYGLKQVAIEVDGKEPSAHQLTTLIERAKRDGVTALFVQPQFAGKRAQVIAEAVGCEVIELDPLARDYLSNLVYMAEAIRGVCAFGRGQTVASDSL